MKYFNSMAEYFDFFNEIPENQWAIGIYDDLNDKKCALGHLGENWNTSSHPFRYQLQINEADCSEINNATSFMHSFVRDLGDTPKERILNAIILVESGILNDI